MLRLAAYLPDAGVRITPVLQRSRDLLAQDGPDPAVQVRVGAAVQVHRVQQCAPHVVLALRMGGVADAHRARVRVPGQVVEFVLLEVAFPAYAVHDLQFLVTAGDVGDEGEEVDGLPVEAETVHRPEREGRVTDPAVAIVVVSFAADGLGQGRGGGRGERTGRRVAQPLQGQGAALQITTPRVIGELAPSEPVLPVVGGPDQPAVGVGEVVRWLDPAPGESDVADVALLEQRSRGGAAALEPQPHVGRQAQLDVGALRAGPALVIEVVGVFPARELASVLEHRLAFHHRLDLAGHAANRAQQDVFGVVVGRGAPLGV